MTWTKDKIYLIILFCALIVAITVTLYFNRKDVSCSSETYSASHQKIFILYIGGAIGMVKTPKGYTPKHGFLEKKLRILTKDMKDIAPYDIMEYKPFLNSSNITPTDWIRIAGDIAKRYNKYDAFVVIHGTDTMAYTASALAFMLENINKPVILTGSTTSLQEKRNDGRNNLLTSLILATKYKIPEVLVCFANRILRGCRSTKISSNAMQDFATLGKTGVETILDEQLILDPPKDEFKFIPINPRKRVVVVKLFPGIDAIFLGSLTNDVPISGIVLETFGEENASTKKDFMEKIKYMVKEGIVIVSVSQCIMSSVNENDYVRGMALKRMGVVTCSNMTTEAAFAKLHFLISNVKNPKHKEIEALMKLNMRGELVNKQPIE